MPARITRLCTLRNALQRQLPVTGQTEMALIPQLVASPWKTTRPCPFVAGCIQVLVCPRTEVVLHLARRFFFLLLWGRNGILGARRLKMSRMVLYIVVVCYRSQTAPIIRMNALLLISDILWSWSWQWLAESISDVHHALCWPWNWAFDKQYA